MDDKSVRAFFSGQPDPTAPRKPLIRSYHYGLLVALGVTFFVALVPLPSRRFSVTTAAWDLVAAHVDGLQRSPSHIPTVAIADMEAINDLIIKASQNCGWGVRPQRQTTTSPYGHPHPVPSVSPTVISSMTVQSIDFYFCSTQDYPYYVTNTNQYALDDILTTRFMDYPGQVNLLGATAPDFIYLPILSQLYSNPWGCQDPTLMEGIKQTTAFIRQIVASVGRTPYPRIILPIATIRSNLERELFKPEFMEEIRDSVIVVSIEGAPKSYKEAMKYMIDVPCEFPQNQILKLFPVLTFLWTRSHRFPSFRTRSSSEYACRSWTFGRAVCANNCWRFLLKQGASIPVCQQFSVAVCDCHSKGSFSFYIAVFTMLLLQRIPGVVQQPSLSTASLCAASSTTLSPNSSTHPLPMLPPKLFSTTSNKLSTAPRISLPSTSTWNRPSSAQCPQETRPRVERSTKLSFSAVSPSFSANVAMVAFFLHRATSTTYFATWST